MFRPLRLIVTLTACLWWSAECLAQEPQVNPERGASVYQAHCLRCHGPNGEGDGPDAPTLIIPPVNFHSPASRAKTDEELRAAIVWGFAFSPMHGWWDQLTREEILSVVAYIRQMAPFQSPSS